MQVTYNKLLLKFVTLIRHLYSSPFSSR